MEKCASAWISHNLHRFASGNTPTKAANWGSSLFGKVDQNFDYYNVTPGIVGSAPGVRLQMHGFPASKAGWYEITDDLLQYGGLILVGSSGRMPDPVSKNQVYIGR